MNAINLGVAEVEQLAKLLADTHNALAAYTQATWDGHCANLYRETDKWAKLLAGMAKRETERYERELTGR